MDALFRLFLLFLLTTITLLSTSVADDGTAILALAKSFTPPPSDWSTTTSIGFCKWTGVQCTSDLRVTSISLADKSLSGVIAPEISALTKLKTVALQRNKLSGIIPSFAKLSSLREIYMDENLFVGVETGAFAGLTSLQILSLSDNKNMTPWSFPSELVDSTASLTTINLENTNISGVLPDVFDSFASLRNLRLSYNNIIGVLPPSLAKSSIQNLCINDQLVGMSGTIQVLSSMTSLSQAWLQKNHFSGPIPDLSKSNNLFDLQLRDNRLTGIIPPSLGSLKNISLDNNNFQDSLPSFPQVMIAEGLGYRSMLGTNSGVSGSDSSSASSGANKAPVIVGVIVVVLVVLAVLGFAVYIFLKQKKYRESSMTDLENPREIMLRDDVLRSCGGGGGECSNRHRANSVRALNNPSSVADNCWEQNLREGRIDTIPITVLKLATNNFSKTLGRGGFGEVYYGELPDKTKVAVKKMNSSAMGDNGVKDFEAEIAVLLKAKHRNLVSLLGYCVNENQRFLVYEYMPQGHLGQHLFECSNSLTWKQRVSIALNVAQGVEYLHTFSQQCFIHRDLKPDNILLGDDMSAKIADFGLVKNAADGKYSVQTRLAGTFGYLAPEYTLDGRVTPKVDVYSFGVILMEMLTGRKVIDNTLPEERSQLVTWFRKILTNRENIRKALDKTLELEVDDETMESIQKVAELAGHCTARERQHRPDMGHVVNVLSPLVEKWTPSCLEEEKSFQIDGIRSLSQLVKRWEDKASYSVPLSDEQEPGMDHAANMLDPLVEKCKSSCQGEEEIPGTITDRMVALRKQLLSKADTENIEIDPEILEALRRQVVLESYPEILEIDAETLEALWNQLILEANADSDTVYDAYTLSDADANKVSDKQRLDMDHAAIMLDPLVEKCKSSCQGEEEIPGTFTDRLVALRKRLESKEDTENIEIDSELLEALRRQVVSESYPKILEIDADTLEVLWNQLILEANAYSDTVYDADTLSDADANTVSDKQRLDMDHAANMLAQYLERYDDMSCEEKEEILGNDPEVIEAVWREIVLWSRKITKRRQLVSKKQRNVSRRAKKKKQNLVIDASMSVPEAQPRLLVSDTDSFSDMYRDTLSDTLSDTDTQ